MKKSHLYRLITILILASLSLGAWWGGGGGKKEKNGSSSVQSPKKQPSEVAKESVSLLKVEQKNEQPKVEEKKSDEGLSKPSPQKKLTPEHTKDVSTVPKGVLGPEKNEKEPEKIQSELKEIINRTQQLQTQVKNNRVEIQNILERARIHEQILRNITLPPSIPTKQQLNPEAIINREKVRLIAEQARQTQEQLRAIQQVHLLNKATQVAQNEAKTPKSS